MSTQPSHDVNKPLNPPCCHRLSRSPTRDTAKQWLLWQSRGRTDRGGQRGTEAWKKKNVQEVFRIAPMTQRTTLVLDTDLRSIGGQQAVLQMLYLNTITSSRKEIEGCCVVQRGRRQPKIERSRSSPTAQPVTKQTNKRAPIAKQTINELERGETYSRTARYGSMQDRKER